MFLQDDVNIAHTKDEGDITKYGTSLQNIYYIQDNNFGI